MPKTLQNVKRLTESSLPTIYGCSNLFDICTQDDLMSLSFGGSQTFLDWVGWQDTNECVVKKGFLAWTRAAESQGARSPGYVSDPCEDGNGFNYYHCDFTLQDFARLRRVSPVRDLTKVDLRYCEKQPRYRLDGTLITDDIEYDMRLATEVLLQDLRLLMVEGNATTEGQFDGLERLVKTGYTNADGGDCNLMDSIVVDWNKSSLSSSSSATWADGDGTKNITDGTSFITVLLHVWRRIRRRIRMAPALNVQAWDIGDTALVVPEDFAGCILDLYTCWSVCDNQSLDELNTLEARNFRNNLLGGTFGAGRIFLDGAEIPILPFDWGLIGADGSNFDAYLLTSRVGPVELIQGEYNNLSIAAQKDPMWYSTDGGRLLTWADRDNTCYRRTVEFQPRVLMWAPWAQARFQDLTCDVPGGIFSEDPWSDYFPYP